MNPLWVFWLLPLVMAPVVYGLQRMRHVAAGLAIAACALSALAAWRIPIGTTNQVFGATLTLTSLSRFGLTFICVGVGAALAYAAWQPQGWAFTPFLLLSLTFVNIAMLIRPLPLGIIFGQMAALFLLFPLQGGPMPAPLKPPFIEASSLPGGHGLLQEPRLERPTTANNPARVVSAPGRTGWAPGQLRRGAVAYLAMMVLITPCFLLALWVIEQRSTLADPATVTQLLGMFLGLGVGILCAVIPLHVWWLMLADDAPPVLAALIGATFPIVGVLMLLNIFGEATWLAAASQVPRLMLWGGAATALLGGLLCAVQRRLGRLTAYSAVFDAGVILAGLGTLQTAAVTGALFCLVHRTIALGWLGIAQTEFRRWGVETIPDLGPIAGRLPVATTALLLGGLALSGWPLSGSFPGRWLIYSSTLAREPGVVLALIVGSILVAAGYLRILRTVLDAQPPGQRLPEGRETLVATALLLVASLLLAFAPNILLSAVYELIASLPFPS